MIKLFALSVGTVCLTLSREATAVHLKNHHYHGHSHMPQDLALAQALVDIEAEAEVDAEIEAELEAEVEAESQTLDDEDITNAPQNAAGINLVTNEKNMHLGQTAADQYPILQNAMPLPQMMPQ